MEKVTIFDVAKKAGVGKSTVSRVINNDENVKPETRKKVLKVIKELNYIPSKSARGMRSKQSKVIGIIASRLDSTAENRTIRGILEEIYAKGYDVVLVESQFSSEKTMEHVNMLINKEVDGLIIFAISGAKYDYLKKLKIPVVMVAQDVEGFTSILYDDYGSIDKVTKYIYALGKKKIAYLGVDLSDRTTGYFRHKAYKDFCESTGLKEINYFGKSSYRMGYELAKKVVKKNVEAIVCATDSIALGVKKYLTEKGYESILVSGVGNDELLKFLYPDHITVNLSYKDSGKRAAETIYKLIVGEKVDEKVIMKSELIKR
ncbi:trehalose operon repressor TreR [uncultured Ilyobacter sp.]|uniref:trehalose operon repressor TreR n=1 Tax=uncultured Ilyobacter sp. TaxID=544433 RepID=UPI0029C9AA24|nr:trehalose operon repressor TreR [uncultured Ilyobacter sp.]